MSPGIIIYISRAINKKEVTYGETTVKSVQVTWNRPYNSTITDSNSLKLCRQKAARYNLV